jgi:glycosyltransferase involved in cell wall biosynthesis
MKIALCIPTWNCAHLLPFALDSLVHQTKATFDVHLFDDASTDETPLIAKKYPSVLYHRNPQNLGYVGNINQCLSLAPEYDWIGILQHDDIHLGESVSVVQQYIAQFPDAGLIFSEYDRINIHGDVIQKASSPDFRHWKAGKDAVMMCASLGQIPCSSTFYNARAIEKVGLYDTQFPYSADEEYAARIAQFYDVIETKEVLAAYRHHEGHTMIKTWRKPDFIQSFEAMRLKMAHYAGMNEADALAFTRQNLVPTISYCATLLASQGYWREAQWFNRYVWQHNPNLWKKPIQLVGLVIKQTPWVNQWIFGRYIRRKYKVES